MSQLFDKGGQQSKKRCGSHRVTLSDDSKVDKKSMTSNLKTISESSQPQDMVQTDLKRFNDQRSNNTVTMTNVSLRELPLSIE
jgi:hypothetical protein